MNPRTIAQMKNLPTTYEIIMVVADVSEQVAFTARKTKGNLLANAQRFANKNEARMTNLLDGFDADGSYNANTGWTFGPVVFRYSGLTERDLATS